MLKGQLHLIDELYSFFDDLKPTVWYDHSLVIYFFNYCEILDKLVYIYLFEFHNRGNLKFTVCSLPDQSTTPGNPSPTRLREQCVA